MSLIEQTLIAITPLLLATVGTAIYLNRRKADKLYQRMFGLKDDDTDSGAMNEMDAKLEDIGKNVRELNHERIDNIEERLDTLQESITSLEERLTEEESDDENGD